METMQTTAATNGGRRTTVSTPRAPGAECHRPGEYEIRLKGHLETRWVEWFEGLSLSHEDDGTTLIRGPVIDQAALHGLLRKVRDLGLPLISVMRVEPE